MVYICQLLAHLLHQSKVTHHREDTDILERLEPFSVSAYVFARHTKLRNSIAWYKDHICYPLGILSIKDLHQFHHAIHYRRQFALKGSNIKAVWRMITSLQKLSIFIQFISQFFVLLNVKILSKHAKLTYQSFRY